MLLALGARGSGVDPRRARRPSRSPATSATPAMRSTRSTSATLFRRWRNARGGRFNAALSGLPRRLYGRQSGLRLPSHWPLGDRPSAGARSIALNCRLTLLRSSSAGRLDDGPDPLRTAVAFMGVAAEAVLAKAAAGAARPAQRSRRRGALFHSCSSGAAFAGASSFTSLHRAPRRLDCAPPWQTLPRATIRQLVRDPVLKWRERTTAPRG